MRGASRHLCEPRRPNSCLLVGVIEVPNRHTGMAALAHHDVETHCSGLPPATLPGCGPNAGCCLPHPKPTAGWKHPGQALQALGHDWQLPHSLPLMSSLQEPELRTQPVILRHSSELTLCYGVSEALPTQEDALSRQDASLLSQGGLPERGVYFGAVLTFLLTLYPVPPCVFPPRSTTWCPGHKCVMWDAALCLLH